MSTTSAAGAKSGTKTKALCVATRCASLDQFVTTYHRFCDDTSFFVATTTMRPVGLETAFSIQLADNTPVLRGLCIVLDAWPTPANQFKRPGIRLGIRRLTADSIDVFAKLKAARSRGDGPSINDPEPAAPDTMAPATIVPEQRVSSAASGVITSTTSPRTDSTLPAWATLRPPAKPAEARTQTGSFAPSQTTKPIPIAAGASQAMAPIAVETLDGKFPVLPRTQTGKAPPVTPPAPEPSRTQTGTPRAVGSAPSLENMLSHPASRIAQGTSEPPSAPPPIVPPQTQPIAMPRTTTTQHADAPAIPRTMTPIPRITPPPIAAQAPPPVPAKRTPPPMPVQPATTDSGWSDDAPTVGPTTNPLAPPSSSIGDAWSQEARSSEAVPEAIPSAKLQIGPSEAIRALLAKRATTPPAVPIAVPVPAPVPAPPPPVVAAPPPEPPPVDNEPTSEGFALGQMEYGGAALDSDTAVEPDALALGQMTYERPAAPPPLADEDNLALGQMSYGNAGAREAAPQFPAAPAPSPTDDELPRVPTRVTPNPLAAAAAEAPPPAIPRTMTSPSLAAEAPALPRTITSRSLAGVALPRTLTPNPLAPRTTTSNALGDLAVPRTTTGMIAEAIDNARVDDPNRTPGSEIVLPANPLHDLTDDMLTGFIECTLYEETANFIREDGNVEGEELVAPPRSRTTTGHPLMATYVVDEATGSFIGPIMQPGFAPQAGSFVGPIPMAPVTGAMPAMGMPMGPPPMFGPTTGSIPVMAPMYPPMPYVDPAAAAPHPVASAEPTIAVRARHQQIPRWLIVGASAFVALVFLVLVVVLIKKAGGKDEPAPKSTSAGDPRSSGKADDKPEPGGILSGATNPDDHPDKPDILSANGLPVAGAGPCRLTVSTTPAGSLVAFDGQAVGPSPIVVDGTCAQHRVDITHARYANASRTVTLEDQKPQSLEITLTRPTHAVTVVTVPADATVSIEGRPAGTSPTVVQVSGYYAVSLTVEKKGYKTVRQKIYSKQSPDRVTIWMKKDL